MSNFEKRQRRRVDLLVELPPILPDSLVLHGPRDEAAFLATLGAALGPIRRQRRRLAVCVALAADPVATARSIREVVRETDGAWAIGPGRVGVILVDAGGPDAEPAFRRIAATLSGDPDVLFGWASAAPGIGAEALVDLAEQGCAPAHLASP